MKPYADTNFFTRLYLELEDTPKALALIGEASGKSAARLPVTWLHRVELTNAFQFHVFAGRAGQQRVTPEQAAMGLAGFRQDLQAEAFMRTAPFLLPEMEARFEELSLRHTAHHGFRTYDLLHVASALLFGCDTFWSFDSKSAKLARLEGLVSHE